MKIIVIAASMIVSCVAFASPPNIKCELRSSSGDDHIGSSGTMVAVLHADGPGIVKSATLSVHGLKIAGAPAASLNIPINQGSPYTATWTVTPEKDTAQRASATIKVAGTDRGQRSQSCRWASKEKPKPRAARHDSDHADRDDSMFDSPPQHSHSSSHGGGSHHRSR